MKKLKKIVLVVIILLIAVRILVPVINTMVLNRALSHGTGCAGGAPVPGDTPLDNIMQGIVLDTLTAEVTNNTPPLEMNGLDFGELVDFGNPRLFVIENNGDATAGDYLGITGAATP